MADWQQRTVLGVGLRYSVATSKKLRPKLPSAKACVQDEHERVKRDNTD